MKTPDTLNSAEDQDKFKRTRRSFLGVASAYSAAGDIFASILNSRDGGKRSASPKFMESSAEESEALFESIRICRKNILAHGGFRLGPVFEPFKDLATGAHAEFSPGSTKRLEKVLHKLPGGKSLVAELLTSKEYASAIREIAGVAGLLSPLLLEQTNLSRVDLCRDLAVCNPREPYSERGEKRAYSFNHPAKDEVVVSLGLKNIFPNSSKLVEGAAQIGFLRSVVYTLGLEPIERISSSSRSGREFNSRAFEVLSQMLFAPKVWFSRSNEALNPEDVRVALILQSNLEKLSGGQMGRAYWKSMSKGAIDFGYWQKRYPPKKK